MKPGLLEWLMTEQTPGGNRPGRRTHPMSGLPLGIGIEAAILAASGKENGIDVLRACDVDFVYPIGQKDIVIAKGEVLKLSHRHLTVKMEVSRESDGKLLLSGKAILVRSVDGRAAEISEYHGIG